MSSVTAPLLPCHNATFLSFLAENVIDGIVVNIVFVISNSMQSMAKLCRHSCTIVLYYMLLFA